MVVAAPAAWAQATFAPKVDYGAGNLPRSVAAADLDGDGDQDLATANRNTNNVSVLLNDGDGTFAPKTDYGAGDLPSSVAAADLDGDGDQDLATANAITDNVSVLLNDGDGTFAAKTDYGAGDNPFSVAAADLDGDGDQDLATANGNTNNVSVLINTTPRADLAVTKSDSADPALVGEDLTYTIIVTNQGPATATNTVLTDELPSGLSFVSASTSRGSCSESGGTVSCSLGNLARNATATVQLVVRPTDSAAPGVSNTARVESDRADFDRADNSDTETTAIDRAPVATDDSYTTEEDGTLRVPAPGVLGNDTDADGDALAAEALSDPEHGTLFLRSNGSFAYFPDSGYSGSDSFTYEASDGRGGTDTATVTITVRPTNDKPDAVDDTSTTEEDTAVEVNVLANDSDPERDALSVTGASDPEHGTATVSSDGKSVSYRPEADFNGTDTFEYTVSDGNGGTDTATVTVSVEPVEDCTITGTESRDFLRGTSGDDVICGLGGNDILYDFEGGNDTLIGGAGVDVLYSLGGGEDTLFGGRGDDYLIEYDGVSANDALDGEGGNDFCYADRGDTRTNCER